ncbi:MULTISPECIES: hypothetical protein [Ramlibacter]|uniref:Uncharacterized protein n=1 Tax=Ramlibacter aquaticus TaxID=2780094 RepID=A0ABR9SHG0_9BURK|nr:MULTISPECIES: hypothetical protein [Ramlibacter]MBE7941720.1 hypothetical protein [Ramlibacter aquaticus]
MDDPALSPFLPGRQHARRLREVYRSAGWPCQDAVEIELLAAGLLTRERGPAGHEHLRVTDAGLQLLASALRGNRAAFDAHEALVEQVAREMARAGRIAWRGLSLRAGLDAGEEGDAGADAVAVGFAPPGAGLSGTTTQAPGTAAQAPAAAPTATRWCIARPDVFSIRNTSVPHYVDPVVHEVKVRRADLLGDLKKPAKRGAYLALGECWYVLGSDARGRPIADPDEVPAECGVMLAQGGRLVVARAAPRRERSGLPFGVWMALAKASCLPPPEEAAQAFLAPASDEDAGAGH